MNSNSIKFTRTLVLLYRMIERADINLTVNELVKMTSQEMYAYLDALGYKYDEVTENWVDKIFSGF